MELDLSAVVTDKITEEGVCPITTGNMVCANVAGNLRNLLKQADPEGYALYRSTKYPDGDGSATAETRVEALRFLFDRSRDLLAPHYLSSGG